MSKEVADAIGGICLGVTLGLLMPYWIRSLGIRVMNGLIIEHKPTSKEVWRMTQRTTKRAGSR
jgi:hypothetical protein